MEELPDSEPHRPATPKKEAPEETPQQEKIKADIKSEPKIKFEGGASKAYEKTNLKLADKIEFYKLHIKHYRLSVNAFKRRTSELKLSPSAC